jgi:hypothetical protein
MKNTKIKDQREYFLNQFPDAVKVKREKDDYCVLVPSKINLKEEDFPYSDKDSNQITRAYREYALNARYQRTVDSSEEEDERKSICCDVCWRSSILVDMVIYACPVCSGGFMVCVKCRHLESEKPGPYCDNFFKTATGQVACSDVGEVTGK